MLLKISIFSIEGQWENICESVNIGAGNNLFKKLTNDTTTSVKYY